MLLLETSPDELSLQTAWTDVRSSGFVPGWLKRAKIGATPFDEVFRKGNLRFLKYRSDVPSRAGESPVVIIPSLINRHYILDLLPKRSLIETFLNSGFETYLMAWGHPPESDRLLTPENLFKRRILSAINLAEAESPTGKVHLVGQCLGGTLATIAALLTPDKVASLSLLTAPLNFKDAGQLGSWANAPGFNVDALIEAYGNIPSSMLQTSFRFLKPSMPLVKWTKLFKNRRDEEFLISFLAMEMWSNDAISFPGLCYKFLIEDLYQKNLLVDGGLQFAGKHLRLSDIDFPVMDAMAMDDHIVPSVTRLPFQSPKITAYDLAGGHIGGMIGSQARKEFWPKWIQWLKEANTRSVAN
jgi:polyhydroxyalkanoate synthase